MRLPWTHAAALAALAALLLTGRSEGQQAATPAHPAPASEVTAPPSLSDPTRDDARLARARGGPATGVAAPLPAPLPRMTLRGLVVPASGGGSALVEVGASLLTMTAGLEVLLDAAGTQRVRVLTLDATGLLLQDVATGQHVRLN